MYFLLKGLETMDSCVSVNIMNKVCKTNYGRAFITKQLLKNLQEKKK